MHHSEVLREAIERSTNLDGQPVPGKLDRDASKYAFEVPLKAIHPGWSLRLGEFIYNTRASLDYLITALVRSTGEEEDNNNQFPIYGIDIKGVSWTEIPDWWDTSNKSSGS